MIAGLLAWLAIEWRKLRSHDATRALDAEVDVSLRVRNVGAKGSVVGIEGLPTSREPGKVRIDSEGIEGGVAGVRYNKPSEHEAKKEP